jgi:hypothetical protein
MVRSLKTSRKSRGFDAAGRADPEQVALESDPYRRLRAGAFDATDWLP